MGSVNEKVVRRSMPQSYSRKNATAKRRLRVCIVSPYLGEANNGNWRTARRWKRHLGGLAEVRIKREWPDDQAEGDDVLVALHARRSAASIANWYESRGSRGLVVVLTGTDLYRDIQTDHAARRSLRLAGTLVVLQECAPASLPQAVRHKARVIFQSSTSRKAAAKSNRTLRAVMVGHLREEKAPGTLFQAARLLAGEPGIQIDHIGAPLDRQLAREAKAVMTKVSAYRWLGAMSHESTRRAIQRAHVLVHTSRMEGGAHVIMEAVTSGTPVLASRIDGNVGMLGEGYSGYFRFGDAQALADALISCRDGLGSRGERNRVRKLLEQCRRRAVLFSPAEERGRLIALVREVALA